MEGTLSIIFFVALLSATIPLVILIWSRINSGLFKKKLVIWISSISLTSFLIAIISLTLLLTL